MSDEPAKYLAAITAHVERHFGKVDRVFHEVVSDELHIDILVVEPNEDRPYYVLVTAGMSGHAMRLAEGVTAPRRAELVMTLLPEGELDRASFADERVYWPIRKLKQMARWPMQLDTWFGDGHTMATDPPEPVAPGVPFVALATLELLEPAARRLQVEGGDEIAFYQVVALHPGELQQKLAGEVRDLGELFDSEWLRVVFHDRPDLCGREHLDRYLRGRRLVLAAACTMAALAFADLAAAYADGSKLPFTRTALGLLFAYYVGQGKRWARWATILPVLVVSWAMWRLGFEAASTSWRLLSLYASLPVWLVVLWLLFGSAAARWFYLGEREATRS